jgi:hypothetical protein
MRIALFALSLILGLDQAGTPPRDKPAPGPATATVRGKVVSPDGNPLHRVRITLDGPAQPLPTAVTDTRGTFEITGVRAGTYTASAQRSGYLVAHYGQKTFGERGRPIVIASGETTEGIDFALVRSGTLAGTVTDDAGIEYPGVRVEVLQYQFIRGRRVPVQAGIATTNDLGQYRISNLPPGSYQIRASSQFDTWSSDDGLQSFAYAPTFYPGVTSLTESETVTLAVSQELSNLNFGMRVGRASRISGVYQSVDGQPVAGQAISLSYNLRTIGGQPSANGAYAQARTDLNGAFDFRNLGPGEYNVRTGDDANPSSITLTLTDGDERSIVLTPQPGLAIPGTVIVDAEGGAAVPLPAITAVALLSEGDSVFPPWPRHPSTPVGRDGAFRFANLAGAYLFRLERLPDDLALARVMANGNDITDTPVAIGRGRNVTGPVQIVVTNKVGTIEGELSGRAGQPTADGTVIVFAADRSRWSAASRFIKAERPRGDGRFTISGLLPGRYRAVARETVAEGQWEDPAFLETLFESATPVEVTAGQTSTLALNLERSR